MVLILIYLKNIYTRVMLILNILNICPFFPVITAIKALFIPLCPTSRTVSL